MRYILSLIVENKHGVLAKVTQSITGRGYNINTLQVAPSENSDTSRMIITFDCDERVIKQIIKQLNKLIDVIKVFMVDENDKIERELIMVRVQRTKDNEGSICRLVEIYKGIIIDVTLKNFVIELTSNTNRVNDFIEIIRPFGIQELLRTGPLALPRLEGKGEK
jgi:acetolactate synthase I/III small subunit